jgi:hypothetical protein
MKLAGNLRKLNEIHSPANMPDKDIHIVDNRKQEGKDAI